MLIATFDSHFDRRPKRADVSWEVLRDALLEHRRSECGCSDGGAVHCRYGTAESLEAHALPRDALRKCPDKNGAAWSPIETSAESTRGLVGTHAVTCAVLDLDHVTLAQLDAAARRLAGLRCVLHSTHGHYPPHDCSVRLVIALDRPALPAEWDVVRQVIVRVLELPADPKVKDRSRLFFFPSAPAGAPVLACAQEGAPASVDRLLAMATAAPSLPVPAHCEVEPGDVPAGPVSCDLESLRDRLKEVRARKGRKGDPMHGVLDRVVRGRALAVPGHFQGDSTLPKGRGSTLHQVASLVAFCLPASAPAEAAIEVLTPCLLEMDCEPQGMRHWQDLLADSYRRAMARRVERDAERDRLNRALVRRMRALAGSPGAVVHAAQQIEAAGQSEAEDEALKTWRDLLLRKQDGTVRSVGENVFTILALQEDVRGTIRFNVIDKSIEVIGGPFAGTPQEGIDVEVTDWLQRHEGLTMGHADVGHRILRVARLSDYDPLREYLLALKWDGTDRLSTWLEVYCGAQPMDAAGHDAGKYLRAVSVRWPTSAVARALDPGCQVDTVLVFEGAQGAGKSRLCRVLGGPWALETSIELGNKDSMQLCATSWILDLSELVSLRRSENNTLKSYFTRTIDRFRPPYAKGPVKFARRCVFVGTTNDHFYLTDVTGNRRYWPVRCGEEFDTEALARDRDQFWAQAVHHYQQYLSAQQSGVSAKANPWKWWLERDEQTVANEQTTQRMATGYFLEKIEEWWYGAQPERRDARITTSKIAEQVLRLPPERVTPGVQTEIGMSLRRMGFEHTRGHVDGRNVWYYRPSEQLRTAPQVRNNAALRLIAREDQR